MALMDSVTRAIDGHRRDPEPRWPERSEEPFSEIGEALADDRVTDVLINGPEEIWVERNGALSRLATRFADGAAVISAVERVIAPLGLRLDLASPVVSARLDDGSRLHAVMPPVAVGEPVVAIRRFTNDVLSLADLVRTGSCSEAQAEFLQSAVRKRMNIVVSGGTGAGKTTMLNALAGAVEPGQRIITIEDAAELRIDGHVASLEARPPNSEGAGEVSLADLVRTALRLRPDRLIVGEVRGPESLDMIAAMNTGHAGSMSTVHANGPEDALWRLETLALTADGPGEVAVRRQLWSAIDLVVHLDRLRGERRVAELAAVDLKGCTPIAC